MKLGSTKDEARSIIFKGIEPYLETSESIDLVVPGGDPRGAGFYMDEASLIVGLVFIVWQWLRRWPAAYWVAVVGKRILCVNARGLKPKELRFAMPMTDVSIDKWRTADGQFAPVQMRIIGKGAKPLNIVVSGEWKPEAERLWSLLQS